MQQDCHRAPLDCPYSGPYRVVARSDKFFTLDLNTRVDTVSIDRLKPAFLEVSQERIPAPAPPPPAPAAAAAAPPVTTVPATTLTTPPLVTDSYKYQVDLTCNCILVLVGG